MNDNYWVDRVDELEEEVRQLREMLVRLAIDDGEAGERQEWAVRCKLRHQEENMFMMLKFHRAMSVNDIYYLCDDATKRVEEIEDPRNSVAATVSRVRAKLKEHGAPYAIINDWGRGYRMEKLKINERMSETARKLK